MSYTSYVKLGRILRDSDLKQVSPCESDTDPDFVAYCAWVEAGNAPVLNFNDVPQITLAAAKAQREAALAALKVTTQAGRTYDADETSQNRIARSLQGLDAGQGIQWVLADNTIATIPKEELEEVMHLAVVATAAIWVAPYQ